MTPTEYQRFMLRIEVLMNLDPEADAPEGKELLSLAKICERYEKEKYGNG